MTIHTTGSSGLALFLDAEDLYRMGLEQERLDEPAARTLVQDTMQQLGMSAGLIEISAFIGKSGAMVVALLGGDSAHPWAFYQLHGPDALLDVWTLVKTVPSRFFLMDGKYYIAVSERAAPALLAVIPEFGVRLYRPQSFLSFLEEHSDKVG